MFINIHEFIINKNLYSSILVKKFEGSKITNMTCTSDKIISNKTKAKRNKENQIKTNTHTQQQTIL
jgi:hypothetical protein